MIFKINKKASELIGLRDEWERVLPRSSTPSITQSWEWMKTWWDVYGKERELLVLCAYQDDKLVGIAPLSVGRKRTSYFTCLKYKTIWFLGSGKTKARGVLSEYIDFVIEQGNEEDFINGFLRYMSDYSSWDEIILDNISVESTSPRLLQRFAEKYGFKFNIVDRTPSILIKLPDSWDGYLRSISNGLRYKIRRGRNEFSKLGGRYHLIKKERELSNAFADLERLHQHRWRSKGKAGAFSSHEWKTFHKKLMVLLFRKGWLKLSFLKLDNQPVAANYNFAFDRKIHFFQSGMLPHENKHIRPGLLLHSYCIEEAIYEGYKEYDFLKVGTSGVGYKGMWGNFSRDLLTIRIARKSAKEKIYSLLNRGLMYGRNLKAKIQINTHGEV